MSELNGEKIDIIPWSPDSGTYISSAISPANVLSIKVIDEEHKAIVEVANDQLSLAIGKGGQNVRLAAKLTGWRIDIKSAQTEAIVNEENIESEPVLDDGIVDDGTEA